jgi:TRAP-type mannitol/chloroaromatic compound transport system permease small subunit
MQSRRQIVKIIDSYTEACGQVLAWLCLAMTLVTCIVVFLRYALGIGFVAVQESVTYMHALLFMACAAFTLKRGAHVRVDIFYRRFSDRTRAWVNSIGAIVFLLPFCVFIIGISWSFVGESWSMMEGSAESGGIHAVYLLKSLIPILALNLILQGVAEVLRNAIYLVEGTEP